MREEVVSDCEPTHCLACNRRKNRFRGSSGPGACETESGRARRTRTSAVLGRRQMPVINRSSFILPLSGVRLRRETPPKNQQSAPVSENSRPSPCPVWGIPHCPSIPAHRPLFIAASCVNATLERQPNTTQHKRY